MFRRKTDQPSIDVSRLSSLIATGVEIAGDVIVTDGVRIDGQVIGNVFSKSDTRGLLVLSEQGRIEGNVRVHDAVVNGTICGDLEVENFIELQANARITGAIRYRTLQMTCGARVEGTMACTVDQAAAPPSNVVSLSKAAES
ncbi:MAG TPA: polymer-forming cytoskeletal protein [Steroidobacteraceae bacterium]|nr:polymer-forming cytoskeletal protein [Steroidobacteraceae bacterium]